MVGNQKMEKMKQVWKQLIDFIEIPFDPFNDGSNRDNIVSWLINLMILVILLYLMVVGLLRGLASTQFIVISILAAGMFILRAALHWGKTRIVSILLVGFIWSTSTATIVFLENGLRAPVFIAFPLFLVVYVGLLHGQRAVIGISILNIVISIIIGVLEMQGIYFTEPKIPDIRFAIVAQLIFIPAVAFMVTKTLRNLKLSISLYRNEAEMRLQSEQTVKQLNQELELAYDTTLEGWSRALELKDKETEGHSCRVTDLTIILARNLSFTENEIKYVRYGALLHDIGKMGVPDQILNKPGALTPEERKIVNQHPVYAYEMLKDIEYLRPALAIPYSHHENWDGTGYPQGLQGEEIPLSARIFAVVDNWDALSSDRPYRTAWPKEKVISYLKDQTGKKFDPQVVDVFINKVINTIP